MIVTSWLITYLVHSTLAYAIVCVLRRRVRGLSALETLWKSAAVLPVLTATAASVWDLGFWTLDLRPAEPLGRSLWLARLPVAALTGPNWVELAARLLVLVGLLWFCREIVRRTIFIRRLGARRTPTGRLAEIFKSVRHRAGMHADVRLTIADSLTSPIALGRREICVPPRAAEALDHGELTALFAHEFAHLRRHDEWQAWALSMLESVLFVQPLNRLARRELQHLTEAACDAWAAAGLADADEMATCLLEVAGWQRVPQYAGVLSIIGGNGLADRIERLLARRPDPPASRRWQIVSPLVIATVIGASPALRLPQQWTPDFLAGYAAGLTTPATSSQDNFTIGRQLAEAFLAAHPERRSRAPLAPAR